MGRRKKDTIQTSLFPEEMKEENEISEKIEALNIGDEEAPKSRKFDVFNTAEPEENAYIHDDGFQEDDSIVKNKRDKPRVDFAEPTNFLEAFSFGDDEESAGANASKTPKQKKPKPEPKPAINPGFDDMSKAKQRKQSKLFAKMIVEGTCSLAELGFVWFATKDTNDAKLIEYELSGEINLQLLTTLESGQEVTIRTWFQSMNLTANQLAAIDQESKDDLADALAEVLQEQGIAPTPTQNLLIVMCKVFIIDKGKALLMHKIQIGSVLSQLRTVQERQAEQEQQQRQQQGRAQVVPSPDTTPIPEPKQEEQEDLPIDVEDELSITPAEIMPNDSDKIDD